MMWIRECLEDLTSAEFASSLDATLDASRRRRKRAVDYENLLSQLNRRITDLGVVENPGIDDITSIPKLESGKGMGWIVYTDDERQDLLK
jgi:hypothetical protein